VDGFGRASRQRFRTAGDVAPASSMGYGTDGDGVDELRRRCGRARRVRERGELGEGEGEGIGFYRAGEAPRGRWLAMARLMAINGGSP
jgi:hypothetical protein